MATTIQHLDVTGYGDTMLWSKVEGEDNIDRKQGIFPITRYENNLNRPRVITEKVALNTAPNANFHLVVTETEEISDDDVFNLFGQIW